MEEISCESQKMRPRVARAVKELQGNASAIFLGE